MTLARTAGLLPVVALAVVLGIGLAGCGSPAPAPAAPVPSPAAPNSRLPARPAELRLDAVQPCSLLTPAQERQLGVQPGNLTAGGDEFLSPVCEWSNNFGPPDNGWLARLVTRRGVDYALDSSTGAQVVEVGGFPAVQTAAPNADPKSHCVVLVDVAQGQGLWTQYDNLAGDYPKIDHALACKLTRDFAEMAVANLKTLAK